MAKAAFHKGLFQNPLIKLHGVATAAASPSVLWNVHGPSSSPSPSPSPIRITGPLALCEQYKRVLSLWEHQGLAQTGSAFQESTGPSGHTPMLSEATASSQHGFWS